MIRVLTGTNRYSQEQQLAALAANGVEVELLDGSELSREQLQASTMAQSLFSQQRTVVLKRVSDNKALWSELPKWLENVAEHITLLLLEPTPDKRTSTYKWLSKHAQIESHDTWTEASTAEAMRWLVDHAKAHSVQLDASMAKQLLQRVGYDQWQLHHAVEKLALRPEGSSLSLQDIIDSSPQGSAFSLLEAALNGDKQMVLSLTDSLRRNEDPYRVFGLLASQVTQLALLSVAEVAVQTIATDTGSHPYSLRKLQPYVARLGQARVASITKRFASADKRIKSTDVDVWMVIEQQLLYIANG